MKKVLCPLKRPSGKTHWMRVGTAFDNRDGSINVYLDAYPQNGKLHIREMEESDFRRPGDGDARDVEPREPQLSLDRDGVPF
jgi:hypothetical protein